MTPQRKAASAVLDSMPDSATRLVARVLHERHPKLFATVENARNVVRSMRGNNGKKKPVERYRRTNGIAGSVAHLPKSDAKPWLDYVIDGPCRVLSVSDIHLPYHDERALSAAIQHGKKHRPDVVLINGDLLDFHHGSRFEKDPEKRDMIAEIDLGVQFLRHLRQQFPKARIVYKLGNHDERWDKYLAQNAPVLYTLKLARLPGVIEHVWQEQTDSESTLVDADIEIVGEQRPILAGKLPVFHGHELPRGMTSPVNPARGVYMRMAGSALIAHGHRISHHSEPTWRHHAVASWSQGCLCDLSPEYARINKWEHGFATIDVSNDGSYEVGNLWIDGATVRRR